MSADDELKKRVDLLRRISAGDFMAPLTRSLAAESIARIKTCFDRSEDPYGAPYAPLVARNGVPLRDTSRLRNGFVDASRPGRVEVQNATKYARLQNYGGKVRPVRAKALHFRAWGADVFSRGVAVPSRKFIPDERGMPREWGERLAAVAQGYVDRRLRDA